MWHPFTNPITHVGFTLFKISFILFLIWCAKFYWTRRRLINQTRTIPGLYPLPFYCILTSPYYIFKLITFLTEQYPISKYWIGTRLYFLINNPNYLKIILNHPHCLEKDIVYEYLAEFGGNGLLTAPVRIWKPHRKIIQPAFNQNVLNNFVPIFAYQSQEIVEKINRVLGSYDVKIEELMYNVTLRTICETAMGIRVQDLHPKYPDWSKSILASSFLKMISVPFQNTKFFKYTKLSKSVGEANVNYGKLTKSLIVKRCEVFEETKKQKNEEVAIEEDRIKRQIFLDMLLDVKKDGKNEYSMQDMIDEVSTIIHTGSDTTANTSCFVLMALAIYPEYQQKVYEEIMDIVGLNRSITAEDIPKFYYLERCIKETLRLFPPACFILRQITQDVNLGKHILPADCSLLISIISIQRSEKYWKDPLTFDPDRFLSEEVEKRHPYSYVPFSAGPRNCIGRKYAMMSIITIVSTILREFKVTTLYKSIAEVELFNIVVLKPQDGFKVCFQPRN